MQKRLEIQDWEKMNVQTYGLTNDLIVPIAAVDIQTIEKFIGNIESTISGRKRSINAIIVKPHIPKQNPEIPLWKEAKGQGYFKRLHPEKQLWVHVDYDNYRNAWNQLGFDKIGRETFLDHILNRASVRITGYKHPYLRLCPISRRTNTNSGLNKGAEGWHKKELKKLNQQPEHIRERMIRRLEAPIVLADPIDMTKMLDISPGLFELQGVAEILKKFYKG
ncbi:MAG: hypothetical protein D8M58_21365 [Calditrichaeota bacterium]|nr:MAG: hypothetical protein DWQ03_00090 [Calditrichota bacterium]MBL1207963.1 hypothetical protein [Calditrichota bacterium]NOG47799.1 hypothetical protein [Calditrichota bacterium]